jgi:hypothetical protein
VPYAVFHTQNRKRGYDIDYPSRQGSVVPQGGWSRPRPKAGRELMQAQETAVDLEARKPCLATPRPVPEPLTALRQNVVHQAWSTQLGPVRNEVKSPAGIISGTADKIDPQPFVGASWSSASVPWDCSSEVSSELRLSLADSL